MVAEGLSGLAVSHRSPLQFTIVRASYSVVGSPEARTPGQFGIPKSEVGVPDFRSEDGNRRSESEDVSGGFIEPRLQGEGQVVASGNHNVVIRNNFRNDEREWIFVVIVERLRAHCYGGDQAPDGEHEKDIPQQVNAAPGALFQFA